jgi:hypothetical protein
MSVVNKAVELFFSGRLREIDKFRKQPVDVQRAQLSYLLGMGSRTLFGKERGVLPTDGYEEFRRKVAICDYDTLSSYILRMKSGEDNLLWPTDIKWFAKSSGTTEARSKYIPVSDEGLRDSHLRGPRDIIALHIAAYPDSHVLLGKTLTLGGSKRVEAEGERAMSGDLSAILLENTPAWANLRRVPKVATALIPDFDEKVKSICKESVAEDVRSFAGVPSWNLVLMNRVLEYTGKSNLLEVWPNMELFIHGGMNFKPYREEYRRIIPSDNMKYMETYNASEGFFSIADDPARDDMLLMLDYGTFYEFLPMDSLGNPDAAVPIEGVRTGVNYAMIITTGNGLWRYMIGDTVEFTSVAPYRIKITGRTKHYINAFGEEIIIDNAENAMREACDISGAEVAEYTAGPVYMEDGRKGAHQWVVEFRKQPDSVAHFTAALDEALRKVNSDYDAKRFKDTTLMPPVVTVVPAGTFTEWFSAHGKIGGQNKVPRLSNNREFIEQLIGKA